MPFEQSFEGIWPVERRVIKYDLGQEHTWQFTGSGVVLQGNVRAAVPDAPDTYVAELEAVIDGKTVETFKMPLDYIKRKYDIFYTYGLTDDAHSLTVRWLNPDPRYAIQCKDLIVYANHPLAPLTPAP